jgi:hypothetical protein
MLTPFGQSLILPEDMRLRGYGENVMKFFVAVTVFAAASSLGTAAFAQSEGMQNRGPYGSPALNDRAHVLPISDIAPAARAALPPYEVVTIVRSMGFDPASRPVLRGPVWVVRAFDDQDMLVRVAVDARTGRVVNVAAARRGAIYGGPRDARDDADAYPVPPASVPGGRVVEETEEITTVGREAPPYPGETYDERIYRAPTSRSAVPPISRYRPAPYEPAPHTSAEPAPHPKVATRTPAQAKPATPKVKTQAVSPAPQAATSAPQEKPPAVAQRAPDTATAKEAGHSGVSIPAPVAHKAAPPEHTDTTPAAPPADQKASDKADDLKLVPVAPLE